MTSPKSSAFPVEIKSHRDLNQASYLLGIHFPGSACLPGLIPKPLLEFPRQLEKPKSHGLPMKGTLRQDVQKDEKECAFEKHRHPKHRS